MPRRRNSNTLVALVASIVLVTLALTLTLNSFTSPITGYATLPSGTPSQAPLVQLADIQEIGSFTLPKNLGQGDYRFGYGATAPGYYKDSQGRETLYLQGHDWYQGQVAQVQIPSSLSGTATLLQGFKDVTDGKLGGVNGDKIGSMMVYNGRLIVSNYIYYDASGSQLTTIGVSSLDLNQTNDFQGFYAPSGTNPGRLGTYMTTIPTEWQSLLGGQALNGACCLSIISRTNWGPGVSVFNPDDVGSGSVVPVKELSRYDDAHGLIYNGVEGECAQQSNVFNCVTTIAGVAFPAGTRSVLFFGRQGTGPMCYKDSSGPSSCWGTGGYNAPPYYTQVWAFDANDLAAVKNGTKLPYQVEPYAIWQLNFGFNNIVGGTFDPATNRMFLTENNGEDPIIHVLKINQGTPTPSPTTDTTAPTVSLTTPANGATVSGTTTISATASDSVGVTSVEFYVDSVLKGTDTISPYTFSWDTTTAANGAHTIAAAARDAAGNTKTSSIIVNVNNNPVDIQPPTTPTGLTATAVSSSQINLAWAASTDNVGVAGYNVYRNGAYIGNTPTNSYSSTGLSSGTTYTYTVDAYDVAGMSSPKSASVSATTLSSTNTSGLLQQSDLIHQGAFCLPQTGSVDPANPNTFNSFSDGGHAMAFSPYTNQLIVQGNYRYGNAAWVSIPTPSTTGCPRG